MMITIPLNLAEDDCSRTLTCHYAQAGWQDFRPHILGNPMPHIAIMEIDNSKIRSVNNTGSIPPDELKYYRIRRLTERECYRLMDVSDDDINRVMASGIARTNHVKLAGNSIVVNCMYEIFRCLFIDNDNTDVACSGDLSGEQLTMF